MQKMFMVVIGLAITLSAQAVEIVNYDKMPKGVYKLDKTHASLTWRVSHLGLSNYTARFTSFDAKIDFDPNNPDLSKVTATIDPMSVRTDYPKKEKKDFDKKLYAGEKWFNAEKFPEIKFVSTSLDEAASTMTGDLTFLGITKPVTLNVKFNGAYEVKPYVGVPAMGFSAYGKLKRSDWGLKTYLPSIGDEVEIIIEAEFHKNI